TLEETHESAGATLSKLNERRRSLTEYVDARKEFFKWWDKQEAKMATLVDKIRDLARDAEDASKQAQAAVKGADNIKAQHAFVDAVKAANAAKADLAAVEKLQ